MRPGSLAYSVAELCAKGGLGQIYDKALERDLLKTDDLAGGEVFTMQSVGNGAGEFGDVQQPTMVDFDRVGLHDAEWRVAENVLYSSHTV